MFCTKCGAQMQPEQRYCAACGKPDDSAQPGATSNATATPIQDRILKNVSLVAILWIVLSALRLIRGAGGLLGARMVRFATYNWIGNPFAWPVGNFLSVVSLTNLALAFGGFVVAIGLLERRAWARTLAIVLAVIALLHPVLGTALGIFTLWVFLPSGAEEEWRRIAR